MKLQDMLQERGQLATQMIAMNDTAKKEKRGFSSEENEKWGKMQAKIEEFDGRIEADKRASSLVGYTDSQIEDMKPAAAKEAEAKEVTQREAFKALLRSDAPGLTGLDPNQKKALSRAQTVGTGSSGGFLVPEEVGKTIIESMAAYGGVRANANVVTTSGGGNLDIPANNDTSNSGAILAENTQDSEQDLTLTQIVLGAYKYTSKIIRVPIELIQDSAFDVESYIFKKFGERLGRATATHYAAGTGSSQPAGINTCTSGVTAASTTAVTYLELLDVKHSVDPSYQQNGMFVFNDNTFLAVKKLLDGNSRPLWQPDVSAGSPGFLDGSRYVIDQGLPDMAASSKSIVFGDMNSYMIRDVAGVTMTRMVERYADYHQVGFVAILRTDGDIVDTAGLRAVTQAAS